MARDRTRHEPMFIPRHTRLERNATAIAGHTAVLTRSLSLPAECIPTLEHMFTPPPPPPDFCIIVRNITRSGWGVGPSRARSGTTAVVRVATAVDHERQDSTSMSPRRMQGAPRFIEHYGKRGSGAFKIDGGY